MKKSVSFNNVSLAHPVTGRKQQSFGSRIRAYWLCLTKHKDYMPPIGPGQCDTRGKRIAKCHLRQKTDNEPWKIRHGNNCRRTDKRLCAPAERLRYTRDKMKLVSFENWPCSYRPWVVAHAAVKQHERMSQQILRHNMATNVFAECCHTNTIRCVACTQWSCVVFSRKHELEAELYKSIFLCEWPVG